MNVIYARAEIPTTEKAIFLAGPTPRGGDLHGGWRKAAIEYLAYYAGNVLCPIPKDGVWDYQAQYDWEAFGLKASTVILFWVPRSLSLPAFTTNIEWGKWYSSGKCVLGYPTGTEKMRYFDLDAAVAGVPVFHVITGTTLDPRW